MFYAFRLKYTCRLAVLGLTGLLSISACDSRDPCQQFRKDYDEFVVRCGGEPEERNDYPDCTEPIARLNECLGECLEDAPCEALEPYTPEQIDLSACWSSCP